MKPEISAEDQAAFRAYWAVLDANRDRLNAELLSAARKIPAFAQLLSAMPPAELERQRHESDARQKRALLDGEWEPYLQDAREQGRRYATMGIAFGAWFDLLRAYRSAFQPILLAFFKNDASQVLLAVHGADRLIDIAMATIGEAYLQAKQDIIAAQSVAIRELSTPVLQVKPRLLIVPLVGLVDTERARQVTESVLRSVRERRARVVVMDVTGVPIVDSRVANHLMQTVSSARLMGATAIICGVSAHIAQTLVMLGTELHRVRTAVDLEEAIALAERFLNGPGRAARRDRNDDDDNGDGDDEGDDG